MDQLTRELAKAIDKYLTENNKSLYRLSSESGVSRSHLGKIMHGKVCVTVPVADKIMRVINCKLNINITKKQKRKKRVQRQAVE